MRVLVVAPHPDDEVLGCGGMIARRSSKGDEVFVAVVTKGCLPLFTEDSVRQVRSELMQAHGLLGVAGVDFLDYPAARLREVPGYQVAESLTGLILDKKPEVLYVPHRGDVHADHRVTHLACLVAARPVRNCPVRKILAYETLSETEWGSPSPSGAFVPTVYEDLTGFIDAKLSAMACYRSQLQAPPDSRSLRSIRALAEFRGGTVGLPAAEAFELIRWIEY